jgi:hypothetical protein
MNVSKENRVRKQTVVEWAAIPKDVPQRNTYYAKSNQSSRQVQLINLRRAIGKDGKRPSPSLANGSKTKVKVDCFHDTQTGMLHGIPWGARCVQRFDDSLNSAIHITYRISLRSSSMREPRDPLLKVLLDYNITTFITTDV